MPAGTGSAYAMLAGRTQSDIPNEADEVFVAALADGKVYIAYGTIAPKVQVAACTAARTATNKRFEGGSGKIPAQGHRPEDL